MNILRYAFKNIFRNFFLSFSSIITIGLLVFFVNILLLVVHSSDEFISQINKRIAIVISFQDGYDASKVRSQEFLSGALTSFPEMSVKYISKEEAWQIFSERHASLASIIEDARENPFPNSVRFSEIPIEKYEQFNDYIASYKDIIRYDKQDLSQKLLDYRMQYDNIMKTIEFLRLLTNAVYVLIWLFLFTAFVMIHMVIRNFIFFLQDEMRIIELVGGKPSFIYGPLAVQGIVYATLGVLFAFSLFVVFNNFGGISLLPSDIVPIFTGFYTKLSADFLPLELLSAVAIGIFSAVLASYKYIHSTIRE